MIFHQSIKVEQLYVGPVNYQPGDYTFCNAEHSLSTISTNVASGLGYDVLNPKRTAEVITGSGIEELPIIEVKALTAIGQTIEDIDVMCLDLHPEVHAEGVLGLNFLLNFDVNISFSKGIIALIISESDRF